MAEPLTIEQADALCDTEVIVSLSDGRSLILSLNQLLSANPRVLPLEEDEAD